MMDGRPYWRDELRAILKEEFKTLERAAHAIGISRAFLSVMLSGKRRLSLATALRLDKSTVADGRYFLDCQIEEDWQRAMQAVKHGEHE